MKADRELDAKMAEVMGWLKVPDGTSPKDSPPKYRYLTSDRGRIKLPEFSTDISAALLVLEKMMIRGDVFIEWWQDGEWFVCDQPVGYRVGAISANCDGKETGKPSLPLAICRFALKVMEAENE